VPQTEISARIRAGWALARARKISGLRTGNFCDFEGWRAGVFRAPPLFGFGVESKNRILTPKLARSRAKSALNRFLSPSWARAVGFRAAARAGAPEPAKKPEIEPFPRIFRNFAFH